jgi:hypothetical protein
MKKPTKAEIKAYEALVKKDAEYQVQLDKYRGDNRIEFFTTAPNPGPNPKQAQILEAFLEPQFKTFGMSGGNRLGKTAILTLLGIATITGKYPWNDQSLLHLFKHNNPRKVRYIGQGWHDHIKGVVIPALYKWWPKNRKVKRTGNGVITDTLWIDEKTKGSFELMSNSQQSDVHEGWDGDLILYDEPCKREIYVANARGLADSDGREVFACTLLKEPWIDRDIVRKNGDDGKPDKTVFWIVGESDDNIGYGITKEGLDTFKNKLRKDEYQARIKGIPEYKSGIILGDFSRKYRDHGGHLVESFDVPLDWVVDIAIDVHPRTEQAVLFMATDPKNERYLIEEFFEHGDGTWVGEEIVRRVQRNSYRVGRVIIDPLSKADSNEESSTYEKIATVLMRHDMILEVASKDKDSGIKLIGNHLKGPNHQASLFVFDNCVRTIWEAEGWMWDPNQPDKAIKKDDHQMENLYRLLLLNTKWSEPFDFIQDYQIPAMSGRDAVTGY